MHLHGRFGAPPLPPGCERGMNSSLHGVSSEGCSRRLDDVSVQSAEADTFGVPGRRLAVLLCRGIE